ncbi:hydroxyacylglutathione hydrolase [Lysobacter ciconiae]|uniref:Hydroxyacylglutathione hydrolase n=1 Tax=Novilysobacter ciconiae TaxID=2781022 RepID=A0A7S6UET5_9GAMM|nr:hydroxyacylglutathione hydrolase [Lysobacter ciconiae]QOW18968.1 hydroxyacylglutathione hydrolase [Lysobacter ciconiae]
MQLQALNAFSDNYIWCATGTDGTALVVDPGEAAPVLAAADAGLRPSAILLTHHHHDHIGGVEELLQRWPQLRVFAPDDARIGSATDVVADGARFRAAGFELEVIAVPGHTSTHVAYFCGVPGGGALFSGDTLFSLGCGRLFEGSPLQMHQSLSRLAVLPASTRLYCGHEYTLSNAAFARVVEPENAALARRTQEAKHMRDNALPTLPSTLESELACNPFLRCGQPRVQAAVAGRLGHQPADEVEVFAELRRWKDGFSE